MGLGDLLNKAQKLVEAKAEAVNTKTQTIVNRYDDFVQRYSDDPIGALENARHLVAAKKRQQPSIRTKKIIKRFYSDYPETPYISEDRPADWADKAAVFPKQSLVAVAMMQRFDDGLLPGHVYMLYWLGKFTNKSAPAYFEYKYGIDFEREKQFLLENGFLTNSWKPTEKGENAISKHFHIIESHTPPKRDRSIEGISKQILAERDSMIKNGFKQYEFIANSNCCEKCAALNGKNFRASAMKIGVNAPPMHEGCCCSIAAWEDDAEYEAWLDSIANGKKKRK